MKAKIYLRVAKGGAGRARVAASMRPDQQHLPLFSNRNDAQPTVGFAINLEIPDAMFKQAEEVVATLTVPESAAHIAAEVTQP